MFKSTSEISKSAILSYCSSFLNIAVGILYTPWLIRSLGTSDYGLYALATSFVSYFLIDFGLGNSVSKYLSEYRVKNKEQDIKNFLGIVCKTYFIICFCLFVLFSIFFFNLDHVFKGLTADELSKFRWIFLVVAIYSTFSFPFNIYDGILIAHEKFTPIQKAHILQKLVLVGSMSAALILGFGVFALVLLQAFSGVCSILYKTYHVKGCRVSVNWRYSDRGFIWQILKFSLWVCVLGICFQLIYGVPTTILGVVSDTVNISMYNVSYTIYGFVYIFSRGLDGVFMPKVSYIENEANSSEKINNLMVKVGRCQLLILGLILSGFLLFGKMFLLLWMGDEFSVSYYITLLLIAPTIIILTEGIATTLLYVREYIKFKAIVYLSATLCCLILSFILSPTLGAVGAAIAVCASVFLFDAVGLNIMYVKKLGLDIKGFLKKCHGKFAFPLLLVLLGGGAINLIDMPLTWFCFGVRVSIYSLLYCFLVWFLFMNEYERSLILNIINKRK